MKVIHKFTLLTAVLITVLFTMYYTQVYRKRDLTGPVIEALQDSITASISSSDHELMEGMYATDEVDGDVTDSMILESLRIISGTLCEATYVACDSASNITKYKRYVNLTDYTPACFAITGKLRFPVGSGTEDILKCVSAWDCRDGDITSRIKIISQDKEADKEGIFSYTLQVTNSLGDTVTLPISVEYYTDSYEERLYYPDIYLKEYLVYIETGEEFQPKSYLDHLELGGNYYVFSATGGNKEVDGTFDESFNTRTAEGDSIAGALHLSTIRMNSDVDIQVPGSYKVTFSCTTTDGYFGSAQMIVIVK